MSENAFLAALQRVTDRTLSLPDLINAAGALTEAGQPSLAQQLYKIWIGFNPDHPQVYVAWFNMSALCGQLGDVAAAIEALNKAIEQNPEFVPAYINLGGMLEKTGALPKGIEVWKSVLARLAPVNGQAVGYKLATLRQLARVLGEAQGLEAAEVALTEALTLNPGDREVMEQFVAMRLAQCKWPVATPWEGVERKEIVAGAHPLSLCAYSDDPLLQLAGGARYVERAIDERSGPDGSDRRNAIVAPGGRRLRVGYVSSDLRDHAIGYLMAEMFELHDRDQVEVFAYYCGRDSTEALHERIKAAVEHWRDFKGLSDDEAALMVARDEIDILVDVNGHTRDARTGVFARRPAPIQVNWLGYPGTMGSPYHHYVIGDPWVIPAGSELYFSEHVVRLPCYQPNDRKRVVAPHRPSRTEAGLPEQGTVFCCFNGPQKITRFVFERWAQILHAVEGSVLWLLEGTGESNARLRAYAKLVGLDPARIVFAPKAPNPAHLARYPLADVFLDTAPYGAHTTASDSLWMGVPVVTLSGRCFASRVCGSLTRSAGLPELVCETAEDYVRLAIELGRDPARVAELKARLEAGRATCDLFNMEQLVESLEGLYAHMAGDYMAGRLPHPDLRNLATYLAVGAELDHEAQEMTAVVDYHGLYREKLTARHRVRSLSADSRLWSEADAGQELGGPPLAEPARRKRAAS
ncbi:N-acetylglucosamine transferase [Phenylobacterium deserti]|uniref:protein O-GlcNAc transferase n=1 Tax=Phenylobacterium deserti TaxID=1914756 RepID=A0A328ASS0_9CAUL|nr:N-acetylglucosamine transferase [Phenylobacterium deserti]RAK58123.1 N-acetylglucosamine transferase [Phenylobacterium deserti]